jgi:cytochrome c-type biogenesis protein CcmH
MLTFWIAASVLTVLALAFIVPPLLKNEKIIDDVQRDDINVAIYQERLAELKKEHLTDEQLAAAKAELDQTLLHDIEHETDALDRPRARFGAVLAVTVLVPALAIAMYWRYASGN